MAMRSVLITVALLAVARLAGAQEVSGITILSYGIYRADLSPPKQNPSAQLPQSNARNICHVMTTWIVPADDERLFGVAYRIEGSPRGKLVEIRRTVRFPDPAAPAGSYVTTEGTTKRPIGALSYGGWGIDEHTRPGPWTVAFFYGDRRLTELNFTVTRDKSFKVVPDENSQCFLVSEVGTHNARVAGR